jgi:hypothetical protein
MKAKWLRSAAWRQAQAMARGESVPEGAEREVSREEILALPEDLRLVLAARGSYPPVLSHVGVDGEQILGGEQWIGHSPRVTLSDDSDDLPDLAGALRRAVDAARAELADREEREISREAACQAERDARIAELLALPAGGWARLDREIEVAEGEKWNRLELVPFPDDPRLAGRRAEGEARMGAENSRREAVAVARVAEIRAEREAWIIAHGSDRLRALAQEDIPLAGEYRRERLATDRPGWEFLRNLCGLVAEARAASVTAEHLSALVAARASGVADARLAWLGIGGDTDEHIAGCRIHEGEECGAESRIVLAAEYLGRDIILESGE